MKNYLDKLYDILFENNFGEDVEEMEFSTSILTLIIASLFLYFSGGKIQSGTYSIILSISKILFYIIGTIFVWFITAVFFNLIMKINGQSGKAEQLLKLSAYSCLPYIFFPVCENLARLGDIGYFIGSKLKILLFLWVIIIYAKSLETTYKIKKTSSYMLIFLPIITVIFIFIWVIGSYINIGYI
jgi:hypothetical protein